MKKLIQYTLASILLAGAATASAGVISDTGDTAYWGANQHGYGDVIGDANSYGIDSATVSRTGTQLSVSISTGFAGKAGSDAWATAGQVGIGYGDLFLSSAWTPSGIDAHHEGDNAANGTHWNFGLALNDRISNSGGSFKLYALNGNNGSDILNSESFITCAIGSQCYYRDGQATAVNTASNSVADTGITGFWTVTPNSSIEFNFNTGNTALTSFSDIAIHWGETCQNDVIEGLVAMQSRGDQGEVPEPASLAIFALGLLGLGAMRRNHKG